jgi:hypothetical protein
MTQTAFRTEPLSPELNHLINDYPCDAWDAPQKFFAIDVELVGRATVWHHTWKDRQFFPELSSADLRSERGLDLLEKDHEVLDDILDRFTRASNRYLKLLDLDPTSAEQELGDIHTAGCHIQSLLSRHLQDEEDMIVPIILHGKLRG